MRSSNVIRKDIKTTEDDKKKLQNLKQDVSNIESSISLLSSSFIKAGVAIEASGDVYGVPFDNGKTKENGMKFKQISTNLSTVISEINKAINALKDDLVDLKGELNLALEREAAARNQTQENNDTNNTEEMM